MSGSLRNLLYVNTNPRPSTICDMCKPWIDVVFKPGGELPLPAHPGCYCLYMPTDLDATKWGWGSVPLLTRWRWVLYTAWMLRSGVAVVKALRELIKDAEDYNESRDEDQGPAPPGDKGLSMSDDNGQVPVRFSSGRVLLQSGVRRSESGRREYECVFIKAGRVRNADMTDSQWLIPARVIQESAALFAARPCYLDHPDLFGFGFRQQPRVKNLVGVTFAPAWSEEEGALLGGLRLYDEEPGSPGAFVGALMDQIMADKAKGLEVPPVGLSAVVHQTSELDEEAGLRTSTKFVYVESEDVVYSPGAGGYIRAALSAIRPSQWRGVSLGIGGIMAEEVILNQDPDDGGEGEQAPTMTEEREARILTAMEALQLRVADLMPPPEPEPDPVTIQLNQLTDMVTDLQAHVARQEEDRVVTGMGVPPRRSAITMGRNSLDQVQSAVEALVAGVSPPSGVRPLSGIRELYTMLSGDYSLTGVFDPERVWLANVTSATMAGLCADALNKRVMNLYQEYPHWWEKIVSPEDFTSLHSAKFLTLGGVGELPTVAEGAAYTEMTWDDSTETKAFIKKGGYLGLTIEAIDKDDVSRLRSAPRALAQAAWLTLSKAVAALFTANAGTGPAMTDTFKVFDAANHGNLAALPLSWAAWVATRVAMRQQTELNSGERLGALTAGYYLLVPSDMEVLGVQIIGSSGEPGVADNDINPIPEAGSEEGRRAEGRRRVIVIDLWTDSNDWAAVAKPTLYPSIGLGFRFGRVPEIFSVASPTAGLMFTNDTMPIKVRFFYALGVTNYRGLYKHNVVGG